MWIRSHRRARRASGARPTARTQARRASSLRCLRRRGRTPAGGARLTKARCCGGENWQWRSRLLIATWCLLTRPAMEVAHRYVVLHKRKVGPPAGKPRANPSVVLQFLECIDPVVKYVEAQFERTKAMITEGDGDLLSLLSGAGTPQVDIVFYVVLHRGSMLFYPAVFNVC